MSGKDIWKWMMYSDPKWYFYGRIWDSRDSNDAADEYEEELPYIAIGILILVGIGAALYFILKWVDVI